MCTVQNVQSNSVGSVFSTGMGSSFNMKCRKKLAGFVQNVGEDVGKAA
jgi:hypothetical protein